MTDPHAPAPLPSVDKYRLLLLPLVALLVVLPLVLHGCSCGHDFDFHLVSWFEAATQIAHGNLHPHWAFTPAWNAGEPRFVFYPPFSWYLGALLGLVLPWAVVPIVSTWVAVTASGFACLYLLREFTPPTTAVYVSALYMVNPYMLFTAYERTAYGELLCAAWLPLLLHAIVRERVTVPRLAVPVALLWLTNAPAAVLGCYGLAILGAARLLLTVRLRGLRKNGDTARLLRDTVGGTALGLGLAGFYIVPAAYEQRYVESALAKAQSLLITDNFLFGRTGDAAHDAVLHTASLIATGLLLATGVALVTALLRRPPQPNRGILALLAGFTLTVAFLLTRFSTPLWLHVPELAFLQFPWRFVAMLTPVLALAVALALGRLRPVTTTAIALLLIGLPVAGYRAFHQECDEDDTVAARLALFRSPAGTEPTDEYTPDTGDEDELGQHNPPFWLAPEPGAPAPANATRGPLHWPLDLTSPVAQDLILNLRDYPAWRVTLNRQLVTERLERADGLIAIPVPAGRSQIDLRYARTPDQAAGAALSAASLLALALTLRRRRSVV